MAVPGDQASPRLHPRIRSHSMIAQHLQAIRIHLHELQLHQRRTELTPRLSTAQASVEPHGEMRPLIRSNKATDNLSDCPHCHHHFNIGVHHNVVPICHNNDLYCLCNDNLLGPNHLHDSSSFQLCTISFPCIISQGDTEYSAGHICHPSYHSIGTAVPILQ